MPGYTYLDHLPADFSALDPADRRAPGSDRRPASGCRPSGSTTRSAASCSRRSPGCPSTTRPEPNVRCSPTAQTRSSGRRTAGRLVELGSGSSEKTRLLLDVLTAGPLDRPAGYVALDVSEDALRAACAGLAAAYPRLSVEAVRADFETQLHVLPRHGRRLVAFLGGTIGNFAPAQRTTFLHALHEHLRRR